MSGKQRPMKKLDVT